MSIWKDTKMRQVHIKYMLIFVDPIQYLSGSWQMKIKRECCSENFCKKYFEIMAKVELIIMAFNDISNKLFRVTIKLCLINSKFE